MKVLIIILFVLSCSFSFAQVGDLSVSVFEETTMKVIPFSTIKIYRNNSLIDKSISDSTGNYRIENLMPGRYEVSCEEKFHRKAVMKKVVITEDKITFLNFYLKKK